MRIVEFTRDAYDFANRSTWFQHAALLLLAAVVGCAFARSFEWAVVLSLSVFVVGLVGLRMVRTYKRLQEDKIVLSANRDIRNPDRLAERRVKLNPEPYLVVGSAVETLVHSTLNTKANYLALGWDPAKVQIVDTKEVIDPKPILLRIPGGLLPLGSSERNDIKFVLAHYLRPFKDNEDDLSLSFKRTDWQTHKTVRNLATGIETNDELAMEFGSLDVELNRVPSSVGLHYIVRLEDDTVRYSSRSKQVEHLR